ncbi:MAG: RNA polymerase sigma factor [Pseudomonadota bacterium]
MSETNIVALRRLLVLRYDDLRSRLTRRLGSSDLAHEILHETWLRLDRGEGAPAVQSLEAYVFRAALNTALDRRRAENRRLTAAEVEGLLEVVDESPGPEQVTEARSDLKVMRAIMLDLPPRQYAILLAARLEGLSRREIAKRFRISVRLVQRELQDAQNYCTARFKSSNPNRSRTSKNGAENGPARSRDEK